MSLLQEPYGQQRQEQEIKRHNNSSHSDALSPSDVLESVIGFSNKWMCLGWALLYIYVTFANSNTALDECSPLANPTTIQSVIYVFQFVAIYLKDTNPLGRYQQIFSSSKYWLCSLNLGLTGLNMFLAFTMETNVCMHLNVLSRVHGLFLIIFDSLGLVFAFLIYGQRLVLEQQLNKRR